MECDIQEIRDTTCCAVQFRDDMIAINRFSDGKFDIDIARNDFYELVARSLKLCIIR